MCHNGWSDEENVEAAQKKALRKRRYHCPSWREVRNHPEGLWKWERAETSKEDWNWQGITSP